MEERMARIFGKTVILYQAGFRIRQSHLALPFVGFAEPKTVIRKNNDPNK